MQKTRYTLISLSIFFILASLFYYLWINIVDKIVYTTLFSGIIILIFYIYYDRKYLKESLFHRSTRYGTNALISVFIILGILFSINFLSYKNKSIWDLSHDKKFTPSAQTIKVLKNLDKKIKIKLFITNIAENKQYNIMKKLSQAYERYSNNIDFEFIDYHENPDSAQKYNIVQNGTVVIESNNKWEKITFISDETLINAIIRIYKDNKKKILFVKGHGEGEIDNISQFGYLHAAEALKNLNYDVNTLVISPPEPIDPSCEILIICAPKTDYSKEEIDIIVDYINNGGSLCVMIGDYPTHSDLLPLTSIFGLYAGKDIIIDPVNYSRDFKVPVIKMFPNHEITKDLVNMKSAFAMPRSVGGISGHRCEASIKPLAATSIRSWAETDLRSNTPEYDPKKDKKGPVATIVINESPSIKNSSSKIVLIGDEDFIRNDYFKKDANSDLFLNIINYLGKQKDLISIRPKDAVYNILTMTKKEINILFYILVIVVPLITMSIGAIVYFKRRN